MKRKSFLILTFLVLAIFLSGCAGGIVTPATDEVKIKSVINEYCLAINGQNWSKAKSYCVYGSEAYYNTCDIENLVYAFNLFCNSTTINVHADIQYVYINGNYSEVYGYLTMVMSACGQSDSNSGNFLQYLQKVGNSWKLYR